MEKDELMIQDEKFKKLFSDTIIKAQENLKYRILQQIETEKIFLKEKKKIKNEAPLLRNALSVLGVMYAIIAFIAAGFYYYEGSNALLSSSFFMMVLLVFTISASFILISIFDEHKKT
jgi:hypothetical protein